VCQSVTDTSCNQCVGRLSLASVGLPVQGKRLELATPKLDRHTVYGSCSACIDPEVKRSKAKVTHLLNALLAWVCISIIRLGFLVTCPECFYTIVVPYIQDENNNTHLTAL